jgi:hypothetical protein
LPEPEPGPSRGPDNALDSLCSASGNDPFEFQINPNIYAYPTSMLNADIVNGGLERKTISHIN